jgi:hypothetical protein
VVVADDLVIYTQARQSMTATTVSKHPGLTRVGWSWCCSYCVVGAWSGVEHGGDENCVCVPLDEDIMGFWRGRDMVETYRCGQCLRDYVPQLHLSVYSFRCVGCERPA